MRFLRNIRVWTVALLAGSVVVGAQACSTEDKRDMQAIFAEKAPSPTMMDAEQWLNTFVASAENGNYDLIQTYKRYLAVVDDKRAAELIEESGAVILQRSRVEYMLALELHDLGRYQEAVTYYDKALAASDLEWPRTAIAFERALAANGVLRQDGILVEDMAVRQALLTELRAIESGYSTDNFSDSLSYKIAVLSHLAGQPDLDRLMAMADRIQLAMSPDAEEAKHRNGTILHLAARSLRDAGRTEDFLRVRNKLAAFDNMFAVNYSGAGDGQTHSHDDVYQSDPTGPAAPHTH